jgi:hypothetical protein
VPRVGSLRSNVFATILRHEWRSLTADASLWIVVGVFAAAIGYGTFNGVRWVAFQREAIAEALEIVRDHPGSLLGSLAWWAGDIATLWASFRAFGDPPAVGIVILCYFLGQLGNLLPLPGGVGGTEGGMTGAFVACGVSLELTLVSVVTYQVISSYLPAIPGMPAYAALRRRMRSWGEPEPEPEPA